MNDYRVPKERASILVAIPPGRPEEMFVLLSPFAKSHQGAETPADIFNEAQAFVPLFRTGGELVLARRDAISWVQVGDALRVERHYFDSRAGASQVRVHLQFASGFTLEGTIALLAPAGERRVIDVMNRVEGFLHLERGEDLFLVNPRRVTAVTVKEESSGGAR